MGSTSLIPRSRSRRRRFVAGAALLASTLSFAAAAAATGGTSVAGAPTIRPGFEESLDTLSDPTVLGTDGSEKTGCWKDFEYWRLPLRAGDDVSIMGHGSGSSGFLVGVFPTSTTDANIRTTGAVANGKVPNSGPLRFSASSTGTYTVTVGPNCHDGEDGGFSFTATVTHGAEKQKVVALLDRVARIPVSGMVTAVVRAPDKTAIHDPKLMLKLSGTWKDSPSGAATDHPLATSAAREGTARFRYRLPAKLSGATVQLKLSGGSGDYQPVTTRPLTVTVG